jgi:hypothetical protein
MSRPEAGRGDSGRECRGGVIARTYASSRDDLRRIWSPLYPLNTSQNHKSLGQPTLSFRQVRVT